MKRISSFTGSQQAVLPIMGSVRLTLKDPAEGYPGLLHAGRKKRRHAEGRLIKRWENCRHRLFPCHLNEFRSRKQKGALQRLPVRKRRGMGCTPVLKLH
jgi:hypothetical protein